VQELGASRRGQNISRQINQCVDDAPIPMKCELIAVKSSARRNTTFVITNVTASRSFGQPPTVWIWVPVLLNLPDLQGSITAGVASSINHPMPCAPVEHLLIDSVGGAKTLPIATVLWVVPGFRNRLVQRRTGQLCVTAIFVEAATHGPCGRHSAVSSNRLERGRAWVAQHYTPDPHSQVVVARLTWKLRPSKE
jgi:hypothetical protein